MDFDRILVSALSQAKAAYADGLLSPEQMNARARRIGALRGRARALRQWRAGRNAYLERTGRHLAILRDGMGARFVAIDVGFHPETEEVEEVGVSVLHGGRITTVNYVVAGCEEKRSGIPCHLGETVVLPFNEIRNAAQAAYDEADFGAFHSSRKDRVLLALDTRSHRYFDTSFLAHRWYHGDTPKLVDLCRRYGIDTRGAHNSGVDSALTLRVLMAMGEDRELPYRAMPKSAHTAERGTEKP